VDSARHKDKSVLITGGGSGIGRATARRFAEEGASHIHILDRRADRLAAVCAELAALGASAAGIEVDLSDADASQRAVEDACAAAGQLDVVISNAAAWTEEPFLDMQLESFLRILRVNLIASFVVGQTASRAMVAASRPGVILFTLSVSALGASRDFAHYGAAKAGTANLITTMAVELAGHGIRVCGISPGPSDTQQSLDLVGEERLARFRESFPVVPMNRLGKPEDMAAAMSFLASDDAAYITGANLVVDGGLTAQTYSVPE
jgi:NAD(P)-dependent dehydrogenase (short-subunit alcohol dehydrogenase family)